MVSSVAALDFGTFDNAFVVDSVSKCSFLSNKSSIAISNKPMTPSSSADSALLANPILAAHEAAPDLTSASGWINKS